MLEERAWRTTSSARGHLDERRFSVAGGGPIVRIQQDLGHFVTRPHLVDEARTQLAQCFTRLRAEGRESPAALKDLACRAIQLKFGPAPPPSALN